MNPETKLELMKHTDSYWMLLTEEIKELILKYKESQELIEWRESKTSHILCEKIRAHGRSRQKWFIGPVECRSYGVKSGKVFYMMIFGHYWDSDGVRRKVFLDFSFMAAMTRCDLIKIRLQYQTNEHVQLPFPEYGPRNQIGTDETHG